MYPKDYRIVACDTQYRWREYGGLIAQPYLPLPELKNLARATFGIPAEAPVTALAVTDFDRPSRGWRFDNKYDAILR